MERTRDGFKLAELDLQIRGPGEFLGTRPQLIANRDDLIRRRANKDDAFSTAQLRQHRALRQEAVSGMNRI